MQTKALKVAVLLIGGTILSFLFAISWWRLWMYQGWIGSPHLLHYIWPGTVDGESSYNVTFIEMWLLTIGMVVLGYYLLQLKKR
jgi:hypothetical protein